jgi:hypothetical protein
MYWMTRYSKNINLTLADLRVAFHYKLPGMDFEGTEFKGGFEFFSPIEGVQYENDEGIMRQHYFIITVDTIRNTVRIYIYKEDQLSADFMEIRNLFCTIIDATKEYLKEHRNVDKLMDKLVK